MPVAVSSASLQPIHLDAGVGFACHSGWAVQAMVEGARVARLNGITDGGRIVLQPCREQHNLSRWMGEIVLGQADVAFTIECHFGKPA